MRLSNPHRCIRVPLSKYLKDLGEVCTRHGYTIACLTRLDVCLDLGCGYVLTSDPNAPVTPSRHRNVAIDRLEPRGAYLHVYCLCVASLSRTFYFKLMYNACTGVGVVSAIRAEQVVKGKAPRDACSDLATSPCCVWNRQLDTNI